jgi:hypothetical protein
MACNAIPNIYKQSQRFADITKHFILKGNIRQARRCMSIAENLFVHGNKQVQNAISNIYVFSLGSFMEIEHRNIAGLFPKQLLNQYYKQINASSL